MSDDPNLYLLLMLCKECGCIVLPPQLHTCAMCWALKVGKDA